MIPPQSASQIRVHVDLTRFFVLTKLFAHLAHRHGSLSQLSGETRLVFVVRVSTAAFLSLAGRVAFVLDHGALSIALPSIAHEAFCDIRCSLLQFSARDWRSLRIVRAGQSAWIPFDEVVQAVIKVRVNKAWTGERGRV